MQLLFSKMMKLRGKDLAGRQVDMKNKSSLLVVLIYREYVQVEVIEYVVGY